MLGLTIGWEYLTGYSVTTDSSSRVRTEWPPHPGRVFMAMAAAWFETAPLAGTDATDDESRDHEAEGEALRWIESLGEPEIYLPPSEASSERSVVTVYVPVNDQAGPAAAILQSAQALTRSRQARTFPRRYVGDVPCFLHWHEADSLEQHRKALARICAKVTRIGHSSSLVSMWLAHDLSPADVRDLEHWKPDQATATAHCRNVTGGILAALPVQTQIPRIETFARLMWQVEDAERAFSEAKATDDAALKRSSNRALKDAKAEYEKQFGDKFKKSASPPPRLRPKLGLWSGYRRVDSDRATLNTKHTHFDTDLLVLTQMHGPRLTVLSTLAVTQALRGTVMECSGVQPVPPWVSGHRSDGSPSEDEAGHLACLPLPFVSRQHADGHLLGVGLVFPRQVDRRERGRVLGPLLVNENGQPCEVLLKLGPLGGWVLQKRDWSEPRLTLMPETWTGHPSGKTIWASVTPVVLDKFPKIDPRDPKQREAWEQEVRGIIAKACQRIGLPQPIDIAIDSTSWHIGSPRAIGKRRPLRGQGNARGRSDTALGDGFPPYPLKGTQAHRPQVHVFLQFAEPVLGPVLLGAGRYRGYGLFKPWGVR